MLQVEDRIILTDLEKKDALCIMEEKAVSHMH